MSDLPTTETSEVTIADSAGTNKLMVNADGSLNVVDASSSLADTDKIFQISETINITGGGTENNFLLIRNPSASGKKLKLIDVTTGFTNTVSVMAYFKLYSSPTITAVGSGLTIKAGRIGSGVPASVMTAYSTPTISVRGSQYLAYTASGGSSIYASYHLDIDQSIIIDPGYDVLLTGTPDGTNRGVLITVRWAEV
jgi:hypothetical protein